MIGVITGDIVQSRKLAQPQSWLVPLKRTLTELSTCAQDWEIYRGDSFQLQINAPEQLLHSAMRIKAQLLQLHKIDVRMGLGIGEKIFQARRVPEANGPAFELSGKAFEQLQKSRFRIETPWEAFNTQWEVILPLAEWIMNRWTPSMAEVVDWYLRYPKSTQKQLSQALGVGQGRISERLSRAGWTEIKSTEALFSAQVKQYLKEK